MRPQLNGGTLGGEMRAKAKSVDELSEQDLDSFPIWTFVNRDADHFIVRPVARTPVRDLSGKLVGTFVVLADGTRRRALLGNIDVASARLTQHFLTLSIESGGTWFHLARYHDLDYTKRGPKALSAFLGLPLNQVFPISYDIRAIVKNASSAASGVIPAKPLEKLSRSKLIALAVP
jgi:hypothetical protein